MTIEQRLTLVERELCHTQRELATVVRRLDEALGALACFADTFGHLHSAGRNLRLVLKPVDKAR